MGLFIFTDETVASVRSKIIGYATTAGGALSNWIAGGVGFQILNTVSMTVQEFTQIAAKASRAFASLDTATDPGDVDPYDPLNQTYAYVPGGLSDVGSNFYGTDRILATGAVGPITFTNTGPGNVDQHVSAFQLTFQRTGANSDGSRPLYRNSSAFTCLANQVVTIPIVAVNPGTSSNATSGQIVTMVSTLPGVTVSNPGSVLGTDLQLASDYRDACREAASLTSPNGPSDSYRYLAVTGRNDGTWGNSTTGNSLGITQAYVSNDSTTGIVAVYYKGASGGSGLNGAIPTASGPFVAGSTTYVQAANYLITNTPGVISVPDAITFSGQAATDVSVPVVYTVKMPASAVSGAIAGTYTYPGSAGTAQATVFAAIDTAYAAYFAASAIGGEDQTAGAGVIYTEDLRGVLYQIQLNAGVNLPAYGVTVTTPAGSTTALALGHDAIYGGAASSTLTFV